MPAGTGKEFRNDMKNAIFMCLIEINVKMGQLENLKVYKTTYIV